MATAIAFAPELFPHASEVSATLPVGAGAAFEIFADIAEIPRWLPLLQTRAGAVAPGRWSGEPGRIHAPPRARIAWLYARVHVRPRHLHHHVGDGADLERRAPRRGAVRSTVRQSVPDAVPPGDGIADRRRSDRERARWPPSISRSVRVPRASAPALLALAPTSTSPPASLTLGTIVAERRSTRSTGSSTSANMPHDSVPQPTTLPGRFPHGTSRTFARSRARRSRRARGARGSARRCLAASDDALPADRARVDARAVRLRGAAALERQVAAASRRDPRRRRAARADPDARSRGARADREGDRRGAARARAGVHQPPPARSVRQAADVAVLAAVEGREPRASSRSPSARRSTARSTFAIASPSCASSASGSRSTTSAAATRAWARSRCSTATSSSSTCRSCATSTSTR